MIRSWANSLEVYFLDSLAKWEYNLFNSFIQNPLSHRSLNNLYLIEGKKEAPTESLLCDCLPESRSLPSAYPVSQKSFMPTNTVIVSGFSKLSEVGFLWIVCVTFQKSF